MKIINCDLCKREIGKQIDYGNFISLQTSNFRLFDFNGGFCYKEKTISDLCSECYNKIAEAQKKAIEEITNNK